MQIAEYNAEQDKMILRPMTADELAQAQADAAAEEARANAVPERIKRKFGRMALAQAGLLANVPAIIEQMPEPDRTYAQLAWEDEEWWVRTNPFITGLGAALGLTPAQIDDLYRAAHALSKL